MMRNRASIFTKVILNSEEQAKREEDGDSLRRYGRIILPLCYVLTLMVNFPLRIALREFLWDVFFYGMISLICVATAIQVYRRFRKRGYFLIAVLILCAELSGWQIFDLLVLRTGTPSAMGFGVGLAPDLANYEGLAWYGLRFPRKDIMCHTLYELYLGNESIAITVRINRNATWYACGG